MTNDAPPQDSPPKQEQDASALVPPSYTENTELEAQGFVLDTTPVPESEPVSEPEPAGIQPEKQSPMAPPPYSTPQDIVTVTGDDANPNVLKSTSPEPEITAPDEEQEPDNHNVAPITTTAVTTDPATVTDTTPNVAPTEADAVEADAVPNTQAPVDTITASDGPETENQSVDNKVDGIGTVAPIASAVTDAPVNTSDPPPEVQPEAVVEQQAFSIPKKSSSNNDTNNTINSPVGVIGSNTENFVPIPEDQITCEADLKLPEGVTLPPSVPPQLLGEKLQRMLRMLPVQQMKEALSEYNDAITTKGETIRNKQAYLHGVLKRYITILDRVGTVTGTPMGEQITQNVTNAMAQLVQSGFCTQEDMNDRVVNKIKMLPEKEALAAIEELSGSKREVIRNFGSYFMGILNRYMRGERDISSRYGRNDSYNKDSRSSYDRRRHRRDRSRSRDRHGGRSREIYNRDSRRHDRSRSRSRDRYAGSSRRHRNDKRGHYGHQNGYHNQNPNQHGPYGDQPTGQAQMMMQQPPMQQNYGMQPPMMGHQPSQQQNGMQMIQQNQQPGNMFNNPPNQRQMPPQYGMPAQMQHQFPNSNMQAGQQNFGGYNQMAPQQQQWQPPSQPQQPPSADILGLADQASNAMKLLQQTANPNSSSQTYTRQQPPSYAQQPNMRMNSRAINSEANLPVMIQYAIQNLKATGHIEGSLDGGICSLIASLPENIALNALSAYSSADLSRVRNKSGYLAGILRKHANPQPKPQYY